MLSLVVLLGLVAYAMGACPAKPALSGGYVCRQGSSYSSTSGTVETAEYCCMSGSPTGTACKISCKNGGGWSALACSCGGGSSSGGSSSGGSSGGPVAPPAPATACGAETTPAAPFYTPTARGTAKEMYPVSKSEVVDRHNCWRKKVSPPAKNLGMLAWDDELAAGASKWAVTCPSGHDTYEARALPNRKSGTVDWKYVGQNICFASYKRSFSACIDSWAGEQKSFVWGQGSDGSGQTGHYTQVVAERSTHVGCAYAYCPGANMGYIQICNYGPAGNFNGGEKVPYTRA